MISIEDAQIEMDKVVFKPEIETTHVFNAHGRILATDIYSEINMPRI